VEEDVASDHIRVKEGLKNAYVLLGVWGVQWAADGAGVTGFVKKVERGFSHQCEPPKMSLLSVHYEGLYPPGNLAGPKNPASQIRIIRAKGGENSGRTSAKYGGPGYFHPCVEARTRHSRGRFRAKSFHKI